MPHHRHKKSHKREDSPGCCLFPDWMMKGSHRSKIPASRRWHSLCFDLDKQMVVFMTKTLFGFVLAMFCMGSLCFEMLRADGPNAEFTTMHFSLISFVAGYFLGSSPRLASTTPQVSGILTDPGGDGLNNDLEILDEGGATSQEDDSDQEEDAASQV